MKRAISRHYNNMRFIHTADWHLGNQMHDIDRKAEYEAFFRFLKEKIFEKKAEALVVAGDVFDTVNPSIEARRLYYTFLASLVDSPCKNVIIVGGNHDSSALLDSARELLEVLNIRVVGSINNLSYSDLCFELKNEAGEMSGICMAVPFVREIELRNLLSGSDEENGAKKSEKVTDSDLYALGYKMLYEKAFAEAEKLRAGRKIPIVATGHLYASGLEGRLASKKSSEKSDDGVKVLDVLGTLGKVPPSVFPKADYVALGHIHYASMVEKNPAVRYSGSPFVMGFDEANIPHCVLFVDLEKNALSVEKIESPRTVLYKRLSGDLSEIKSELKNLSEISPQKPTFLELCYKKEIGVNAQEFLSEEIRALSEKYAVVSWKIAESDAALLHGGFEGFDASEIKNLDDKAVFTELILSKSGLERESEEGKALLEKFLPLFMKIAEGV
mgnify:CR=1 FL=1